MRKLTHARVVVDHSGLACYVAIESVQTLNEVAFALDRADEFKAIFARKYPDVETWVELLHEGENPFDRMSYPGRPVHVLDDPVLAILPLGSAARLREIINNRKEEGVGSDHATALLRSMKAAQAA